mgnify:FL=1
MKFSIWRRNLRVESQFLKSLLTICSMFDRIAKSVQGNVAQYNQLMAEFQNSQEYSDFVMSTVERMVTGLNTGNYYTWRKAAREATKGNMLYRALLEEMQTGISSSIKNQIMENANLIRTLPTDTAQKVVQNITEEAYKGKRASEIARIIQEETSKHSRASARLIARTEVSKATTALTKARSEDLGLKWYVWRTALDGDRVRKSHRNMEGVLVAWSNPPSPEALVGEPSVGNYHAGNIWNCRCYPEPLISVDDVTWPHKVYYQGTIRKMGKREFEQLA